MWQVEGEGEVYPDTLYVREVEGRTLGGYRTAAPTESALMRLFPNYQISIEQSPAKLVYIVTVMKQVKGLVHGRTIEVSDLFLRQQGLGEERRVEILATMVQRAVRELEEYIEEQAKGVVRWQK